jgi:hypothetical protein
MRSWKIVAGMLEVGRSWAGLAEGMGAWTKDVSLHCRNEGGHIVYIK